MALEYTILSISPTQFQVQELDTDDGSIITNTYDKDVVNIDIIGENLHIKQTTDGQEDNAEITEIVSPVSLNNTELLNQLISICFT